MKNSKITSHRRECDRRAFMLLEGLHINAMGKFLLGIGVLAFSLSPLDAFAGTSGASYAFGIEQQKGDCTGVVKDMLGETVIGASVVIKGTSTGTITNLDGEFTLSNVPKGAVLQISFVGYVTQEIEWKGVPLNVVMKDDTQTLDEVVVVGFGTQKKVNLTGSVSTVDSEALASRPITQVAEALQGLVPGLNVSLGQYGGQLDQSRSIDVRGAGTIGTGSKSSPLVLIDGMEGDLTSLNPQDVENISVLKDAAASSIYGSRAPFGVILITTKAGKSGKTTVNYNNSFRFDSPLGLPESIDSHTWALYFNDADRNGDMFSSAKLQQLQDYQSGKLTASMFPNANGKWEVWDDLSLLPIGNTDWMKTHYKDQAFSQEHAMSVNGGNEKYQFYFSTNFLDKSGLLRHADDSYGRFSVSAKINAKINKYVSATYSARFIRENYDAPSYLTENGLFFHDIARYWPIIPVTDPNGHYTAESKIEQLQNGGRYNYEKDWLYQQASITVEPIKGWKIIGELNYRTDVDLKHTDYLTTFAYDVKNNPFGSDNTTTSVSEKTYKNNFFNPNVFTEYSKEVGVGHNLKAMLGFQAEMMDSRESTASRNDLMNPSLPTINTATGKESTLGGYSDWATAGFFGRLNYDYQGKYLMEVNARYDGTSRFLRDSRWRMFPSVSAGWNVAREHFWEPYVDLISTFKLRGSWGELGNQNTENLYPFYSVMNMKQNGGFWLLNGKKPNTSNAPNLVSSLMTWERISSWNIGLDMAMFRNRLNFSFDYFNRQTLDMVGPAPELPAILGIDVPKVNNANMKSYGFELTLSWRDRIQEFSYGATFLLSDDRQQITEYPNEFRSIYDGSNNEMWYTGKNVNDIWGYTTKGIAKTQEEMNAHLDELDRRANRPTGSRTGQNQLGDNWLAGDIMYEDLDGDGVISRGEKQVGKSGDYSVIGNSTPRFKYALTLDGAYKGFDLKLFFQGVGKRDFAPSGPMFWGAAETKWQAVAYKPHLDYFRDDANHPLGLNLDGYYPRLDMNSGKNQQTQTRYMQNAAYIRLKNLQVGYTLPKNITSMFYVSNLRLFFSAENLFTITSLSDMFDPETVSAGRWGGNGKTYPIAKTISFGLSLTL